MQEKNAENRIREEHRGRSSMENAEGMLLTCSALGTMAACGESATDPGGVEWGEVEPRGGGGVGVGV